MGARVELPLTAIILVVKRLVHLVLLVSPFPGASNHDFHA
jgi:hypothetical protein